MKKHLLLRAACASAVLLFAASSSAQDEIPPPEPPRKKTIPVLRLDGGYAHRRLFDLPINGGAIGLAFGAERGWLALHGSLQGMFGSTTNGLATRTGRVLFEAEAILDRFRFGLGTGFLFLGIERAVRDDVIPSHGLPLLASLRFDVARFEDGYTIFARATFEYVALLKGPDTDFWGPSIGAGFDFDL